MPSIQQCAPCDDTAQDIKVDPPNYGRRAGDYVRDLDVGALLAGAIDGTGHARKEAAGAVGYNSDYFSRVLTGERGITLNRLALLPLEIQKAFVLAWASMLGIMPKPGFEQLARLADLIEHQQIRITLESKRT